MEVGFVQFTRNLLGVANDLGVTTLEKVRYPKRKNNIRLFTAIAALQKLKSNTPSNYYFKQVLTSILNIMR